MRKLTENQQNVLSCLTKEYSELMDICKSFAVIQAKKGYNPNGCIWSNTVSLCLNSLIKRELVVYKYRGLYKLK